MVSVLGDIQNPMGHGPEQPCVEQTGWSGKSIEVAPTSVFLCFVIL